MSPSPLPTPGVTMQKPDKFRHRRLIESLPKKRRVTIDEYPTPALANPRETDITKQEENFLRHWVTGYGSPTAAARKAGFPAVVARQRAWEMMSDPRIKRRLAEM